MSPGSQGGARTGTVLRLPSGWTPDGRLAFRAPGGLRVTVTVEDVEPGVDASAHADAAVRAVPGTTIPVVDADDATTSLGGVPVVVVVRTARTPPDGPAEASLRAVAVLDGQVWTVDAVVPTELLETRPRVLEEAVEAVLADPDGRAPVRAPLLGRLWRGLGRVSGTGGPTDEPAAVGEPTIATGPYDDPVPVRGDEAGVHDAVRELLERAAEDVVDEASLRGAMRGAEFEQAVGLLVASGLPGTRLLHDATRDSPLAACARLEAVARRPRDPRLVDQVLAELDRFPEVEAASLARVLAAHADGPLVERVLAAGRGAEEMLFGRSAVHEVVAARMAAGEDPDPERLWALVGDDVPESLPAVLDDVRFVLPPAFTEAVESGLRVRADHRLLRAVGRLVGPGAQPDPGGVLLTAERVAALHDLEAALEDEPPRSTLVLGPPGSGRSTVIAVLTARLRDRGWTIFEARAADVVAGQKFVGELEERVAALARALAAERTLWVLPAFGDTYWAGRHHDSPRGVLDLLLPLVAAGRVRVVGELDAGEYERLAALRPALRSAFGTVTIRPLDTEESLEVARRRVEQEGLGDPAAWEPVLREALLLARHYLRDERLPGSLLRLIDGARLLVAKDDGRRDGPPTHDDLAAVVSARTGVPVDLLDERRPLDLDALRRFFESRVLGQDEAVTTLVDRVAMIKAGLTDPSRPQGVFLFVGPTGTGKTELAKALAERVFGSPERLLRLDMSEFQTADSLSRLTGEAAAAEGGGALVDRVRAQPFSVVLLDEFEKAHPAVWDLFLQVFDDGRLTDAGGRTADFRHCMVIITSNLGAAVPTGGVGFAGETGASFAPAAVRRAVEGAFRPEFLNRLDRVVVFRPLARETMRQIVHRELEKLLDRRGLRTRAWAIEWDASAIEFLLERGFSPDLGARPLTRAIDEHLLAPLSRTIVARRYPEGDQFLFVRASDGRALDVVFVDPDADAEPRPSSDVPPATTLRALALDPRGGADEWAALGSHLARLRLRTGTDDWSRRKADALRRIAEPGFWDDPGRFAVLGLGEYVDRLEAGLRGAESLLRRGTGPAARGRGGLPAEIAGQLATRLFLLETALDGLEAGAPADAIVAVRPGRPDDERGRAFAGRVADMYRRWGRRRGMTLRDLDDGDDRTSHLLTVSGFGAHAVLAPEAGVHVLEVPRGAERFDRVTVHVAVAPYPDEPLPAATDAARAAVRAALAGPTEDTIVRRYRDAPSPLVRDAVRGWRTGRLERVLDGDFDLFE